MTFSRFFPSRSAAPRRAARAQAVLPETPPLVPRALAGAVPGEPPHAATVVRRRRSRGAAEWADLAAEQRGDPCSASAVPHGDPSPSAAGVPVLGTPVPARDHVAAAGRAVRPGVAGAVGLAAGSASAAPRDQRQRQGAARTPLLRRGVSPAPFPGIPPAPPDVERGRESDPGASGSRTDALPLAARRALGGLVHVLNDPELRDLLIQVRGGRGVLWLDRGGRLQQVPGWGADPEAVHRLASRLVAAGGRHIDELVPYADVRLGDGIRVHAVLPPIAVAGATVSIRLPRLGAPGFAALVHAGLCDTRTAQLLVAAVRSRRNILITGGTGSGKTTLLASLLDLAAPNERIVTIEDLAELRLQHPHAISLEARQASTEGVGQVSLASLLREALRMRPDRIVLGECRGAELATLLTALNTGHDGGAGTLHASGLGEVPARLEALGAVAGMTPVALARQAASALHLIVHLSREAGMPRVTGIGRLVVHADGELGLEEWRS